MSAPADLARLVVSLAPPGAATGYEFTSQFPGVEFAYLYRHASGASAALLRYAKGARVARHRHPGFEHIYVLEGAQQDEYGEYSAGTLLVNPPNSEHAVYSPGGCLVLAIWQLPVEFLEPSPR